MLILAYMWLIWTQEQWERFMSVINNNIFFNIIFWKLRFWHWESGGRYHRSRIAGFLMLLMGIIFCLPLVLYLS